MGDQFEAFIKKERVDDIGYKYRHVFGSPMGREVLADLLNECHFGSTLNPENEVQIAEHNVGITVLAKCGIFGEDNRMDVINALLNVMPKSKEVEK